MKMTGKEWSETANNKKCCEVVQKIKEYFDQGLDPYSVFASYLFDVPYEDCCEGTKEGKWRRTISKKLLLANTSFDEMYDYVCNVTNDHLYSKYALRVFIMTKFPYFMESFDGSESRTEEDAFTDAMTFISWILGYVQISKCFNKISKRKSDLF